MQIYIMRHGQAEMMANCDAERNLTSLGREESEMIAKHLVQQNVSFDAVLVSPYIRAQQTWESVSPFFEGISRIHTLPFLTPSGSVHKTVNELYALQAEGLSSVLVVSHLPLVSYIVGELAPEAGVPAFPTSAVGCVKLEEQSGTGQFLGLTTVLQAASLQAAC